MSAFFVDLGFVVEGRTFIEGEFLDTVIGMPDSRSELLTLRPPDGGAGLELASFIRPRHEPGRLMPWPSNWGCAAWPSKWRTCPTIIERLAKDGYGLAGGVGDYEHVWRMASVRRPEGILVSLAERIG